MPVNRISMISEIYDSSVKPLYTVLDGITDEQLNWRPAPDSRSVNEILCHLIRVDNSFLKKLGQVIKTEDPKNGTASDLLAALKNIHGQIRSLVNNCIDDSQLFVKSSTEGAEEKDNINEHILHSCQHNLYHLAQIVYLRRALDRKWKSPSDEWDSATRIIARFLNPPENDL